MLIDTFSIIAICTLVLLVILSSILNPFLRNVESAADADENEVAESEMPAVSIVVLATGTTETLDAHLSVLLTQNYEQPYGVIVVGVKGDLSTEDVIGKYSVDHKNLYSTYIPQRSLFISKQKLSVALGVKAAHNEWIVLLDAKDRPASSMWLRKMAAKMDKDTNLVLGYSNYDPEAKPYYRFDRLRNECYLLRKASRKTAYRTESGNFAFRRSEFLEQDGYLGNLQYVGGEYEFLINKFARTYGSRIAVSPEAFVIEDVPNKKAWLNRKLYLKSIRKDLERTSAARSLYAADLLFMYLNYIAIIAAAAYSGLTMNWILMGTSALTLILTITSRILSARKAYRKFEADLSLWTVVFYEFSIVFHKLSVILRYRMADKYDFTTHKL